MEQDTVLDDKNVLAMKLLHYFITQKNYNPIILQGLDNEIWLENFDEDCKVVRIVSGYIHNTEQFNFDIFKTKKILGKIKKQTFSFKMNVLSIFLDLGENVDLTDKIDNPNLMYVNITNESDLLKSDLLNKVFPGIEKELQYNEKGEELFMKITKDINKHNQEDAKKVEKVFKKKFPMITYILIAINIMFYIVPILFNQYEYVINVMCTYGPLIRAGQYYRLFTGMFAHAYNPMHVLFNCYALYVVGSQMESFLGKFKFLLIYLISGLCGALLSITMNGNVASIGASGAIFGVLGSMIYFGYYYRVYLGNVLKSQIIPIIILNLLLGFIMPTVDNAAHIGGLIGGGLMTMALGVDDKSSTFEKVNGWIVTIIFISFLTYMAFVYTA